MHDTAARRMWGLIEPVHVVTYFTAEARAEADRLGMRGFWMGYVAQRVAPLGAVNAAVATAAFHGFHPDRLSRALPDAWHAATAAAVLDARLAGVDGVLRRLWGDEVLASRELVEAADLAWRAAQAADCGGRVLAAANQALPRPSSPHLALWQATATLREHRGDGHVAVLVARGITPVQSHLLKAGADEADAEQLREGRRFGEHEWGDAVAQLQAAGVLDSDVRLTGPGWRLHEEIEAATDNAAAVPWRLLGEADTARLADLLEPLAGAVIDTGTLPMPNAVGLVLDRARRGGRR